MIVAIMGYNAWVFLLVCIFVWMAMFFRRPPGWGLLLPCLCGVMRPEEVA
jgi:hypothetical protein